MKKQCEGRFSRAGFTLWELLLCLAIMLVVAAVLFPIFARPPREGSFRSCLSNVKQVGLGLIQYAQDYDSCLPRAHSLGKNVQLDNFPGDTWENAVMPYIKTKSVFHCPSVPVVDKKNIEPTYRYSDLVAGANTQDASVISAPSETTILMDGDVTMNDVGHAWTPGQAPEPAIVNSQGLCEAGQGATVQEAPMRHNGGANYLFADGHAKGILFGRVFFPPKASASRSHKDADGIAIGPNPAGDMKFAGTTYAATFHLH